MQATSFHDFAAKNSGFNALLYAVVGTELNGSTLTVLSMLARLDQDPWTKAAGWATLPRAIAIDDFSQSIVQMPLAPPELAANRDIAARLLELLPVKPQRDGSGRTTGVAKPSTTTPEWQIWCGLVVWMLLNVLLMHNSAANGAAPVEGPAAKSESHAAAPKDAPLEKSAARIPR